MAKKVNKTEKVLATPSNSVDIALTSLKTVGITFVVICCAIVYWFSVMFIISPSSMADIYSTIGAKNANYSLYASVFNRTQDVSDLYNILQLSIQSKKYDKVIYYGNLMLERKDFDTFASKVDKVSSKKITSNNSSNTLISYEAYVRDSVLVAMYNLEGYQAEAYLMAVNSVLHQTNLNFEMGAYIDCVQYDKTLTQKEKTDIFVEMYSKFATRTDFESIVSSSTDGSIDHIKSNLPILYFARKVCVYEKILCTEYLKENEESTEYQGRLTAIENKISEIDTIIANILI